MTNPLFLLETERLILRRFRMEDAPTLIAYRNDPLVAIYQSWESMSEVMARHLIQEMAATQPGVAGEWFQYAIQVKAGNDLAGEQIGDVAFHTLEDPRQGEVGYTLARHAQRRGYALEAVGAVVDHAFRVLQMHRLAASVDVENPASFRLLEKLGFRREGTLIDCGWFHGKWCSEHVYAMLRDEWQSRKS